MGPGNLCGPHITKNLPTKAPPFRALAPLAMGPRSIDSSLSTYTWVLNTVKPQNQ